MDIDAFNASQTDVKLEKFNVFWARMNPDTPNKYDGVDSYVLTSGKWLYQSSDSAPDGTGWFDTNYQWRSCCLFGDILSEDYVRGLLKRAIPLLQDKSDDLCPSQLFW
jgi:hypothetical protein